MLHNSGNSKQASVSTKNGGLERGAEVRFKRVGTYVYPWLTRAVVWQRPTQFCKAIIIQLKKINLKLKRKRPLYVSVR